MTGIQTQAQFALQETYRFIDTHLLPALDWPALSAAVAFRRNTPRPNTAVFSDTLPLVVYQALGGEPVDALPLNACWLLHLLAARVFDDIQDEEGSDHPWHQDGLRQALPTGIGLQAAATLSLAHLSCGAETLAALLEVFGRATAVAARAQSLETVSDLADGALDRYFAHIGATTAEVFGAGTWAGGRLYHNEAERLEALYNFGYNFGLYVAILDDCLDVADVAHGRFRLPVLYAASLQEHPAHPELLALLSQPTLAQHVDQVQGLLGEMGAVIWSANLATAFRQKAVDALQALPQSVQEALIPYVST